MKHASYVAETAGPKGHVVFIRHAVHEAMFQITEKPFKYRSFDPDQKVPIDSCSGTYLRAYRQAPQLFKSPELLSKMSVVLIGNRQIGISVMRRLKIAAP